MPNENKQFAVKYKQLAEEAVKGTKLNPITLLTQAALESSNGTSAGAVKYGNFFGIKADPSWKGKKVYLPTTEYKNGKKVNTMAWFRQYDNPVESFKDYVTFLHVNPRYKNAVTQPTYQAQLDGIIKAGYATGKYYSNLVRSVTPNIYAGYYNTTPSKAPAFVSSKSQVYPPPVNNNKVVSDNSIPTLTYDPNTLLESEPIVRSSQLSPIQPFDAASLDIQTPQMVNNIARFTSTPQPRRGSLIDRILGNDIFSNNQNPFVESINNTEISQPIQVQQPTIQQPIVQPSFEEQVTQQTNQVQTNTNQQPIVSQPTVSQPAVSQASDDEWIKTILNFEKTKGGFNDNTGQAYGLDNYGFNKPKGYYLDSTDNKWKEKGTNKLYNGNGQWKQPTTIEEAKTLFKEQYLAGVQQYPAGIRERVADFSYNTGRDHRVYLIDQYLKSIGQSGIPNRGAYNQDTNTDNWTPELQKSLDQQWNLYKDKIAALPIDQQTKLLDQGRDFYYQNINQINGQPNPAYGATWKYRPFMSSNQQPPVTQNTAVQTPPAAVVQNPPATVQPVAGANTNQAPPAVKQYTPSNILRAAGDEDTEGSVLAFLNTNQNTQTTQQAPLGSNTGVTTNTSQQPIVNTTGATTTNITGTTNTATTQTTGTPSNMMRVPDYLSKDEPLVSIDPANPPQGVDPLTGVDPRKMEWLNDPVRNQMTELKDIEIKQEPVPVKKQGSYKPYDINPFTTGLNIFNSGLNTIGGMRNMNRIAGQERLNSFISQQPEAVYPNKRMLYGDKAMFAQYGGEYSHGGMYPEGGSVYQPEENIGELVQYKKGGIYIKPENKGKFTAWADAHGMSVQEAASHVMANKENYSSTTVKRANFAKNASKFKHEDGGMIEYGNGGYVVTRSSDRKGKTHKVTGPDGSVKYFGDSKMGQHPSDPERKAAFYARHKSNLEGNPYFRAFARKTWEEGGEINSNEDIPFLPSEFLEDAIGLANGGMINEYAYGGTLPPIYTTDPRDPRLQSYNDSAKLFNNYLTNLNTTRKAYGEHNHRYDAYTKSDTDQQLQIYKDVIKEGLAKKGMQKNKGFVDSYVTSDLNNVVRRGVLPAMTYLSHSEIMPIGIDSYVNGRRSPGGGAVYYARPGETLHAIERYKKPVQPVFYKGVPVPPPVPKPKPKPKPKPVSNLVEVSNTVTPVVKEPTVATPTIKTPVATPTVKNQNSTKEFTFYMGDNVYKTMDMNKAKQFSDYLGVELDENGNTYTYDKNTGTGKTWMTGADGKLYPSQKDYNSGAYKNAYDATKTFGMTRMEYGGMIKRADGSYSKRGLWDNIRANKGSGKKPTKEMLKQERKIKKGYKAGGEYMEGNEYEISGAELERLKSLGYEVEMI